MTDKENMVVEYLKDVNSAGSFDGDWFFTDEMRVGDLSQKALGGVLSSLEQKGIVECANCDGDNMVHLI